MGSRKTLAFFAVLVLLSTGQVWAQANTGKLTGRVVSTDGQALPGVTVTATSPALQGERIAITAGTGSYVFPGLPAGDYTLVFDLEGFQSATRTIDVPANQTREVNVELDLTEVSEEIVVTGELGAISETITSQSTYEKDVIEKLAVTRSIEQATLLAPGVHATGPENNSETGAAITISGAQSYESLFMVNGVVVNENLRGQPIEFIIEDAVQETTISTSGVSAEYGRFAGGMVNVITRSGGNEFHGSFRINVDKEAWEGRNDLSPENQDNTQNETYEATLGGWFWKDHLWFFLAGRDLTRSATSTLAFTNIQLPQDRERERREYKLTVSPTASHRVIGSYAEREATTLNEHFGAVDLSTVNPTRSDPEELVSGNYTGVLTSRFFLEAQYSERDFIIGKNAGGTTTDFIGGTWIVDLTSFTFIGSPVFCAVCKDQQRNNQNTLVKGSYFLPTQGSGDHDLVFGYDTFSDILVVENHQSGSDFSVWTLNPFIYRGQQAFPQLLPAGFSRLRWDPVLNPTLGADFETESIFVNDSWRLNDKWSFNLGLRYDENHSVDAGGALISDADKLSPRLGAAYDLKGDGDIVVHATAGRYAHQIAISGNVGTSASSAGALANFTWLYGGPPINPDRNAPTDQLLTSDEAIVAIKNWFDSIGGINNQDPCGVGERNCRLSTSIPGVGTQIREALETPYADELTVGVTKRLGNRGLVRADLVFREFGDFYVTRVDTSTGQVQNPDGSFSDLNLIENNDSILEREYQGLHSQFTYRVTDRLDVGANWTLSWSEGNFDGETADQGPLTGGSSDAPSPTTYPELKAFPQHNPDGYLAIDQRHKAAGWAIYDVLQGEHHNLSVSLAQIFVTGTPYGAQGQVDTRPFVDVDALGYLEAPPTVAYFFTGRDAFRTDDITRTDVALNYAFSFNIGRKPIELFLQPEIINVFNQDSVGLVDTTVFDAESDPTLETFNPFTETPVEGVHWRKGDGFGEPTKALDFQAPREFRFSVGFRF